MPLDSHFGRWFRDQVQLVSRMIHGGLFVGRAATPILPHHDEGCIGGTGLFCHPRKICVAAACAYSHLQTGPPTAEAILTVATWQLDNAQNKRYCRFRWCLFLGTRSQYRAGTRHCCYFSCCSPVCLQWWIFSTIFTVFVPFDVYLKQHHGEAHLCDVHDFDGSQLSSFDMTSLWRHKT